MAGPVIAVTDSVFPSLDPAKAALAKLNPTFRMAKSANADDILAVAKDADAILVTYAKLTRDILTQLTKCKAIGRFGLGVDNIDLVTAKEKGIAVNYVPDYCIREVSDHAMALLLALIRKIPLSNKLVQGGRWEMPAVVPIRRIEAGFCRSSRQSPTAASSPSICQTITSKPSPAYSRAITHLEHDVMRGAPKPAQPRPCASRTGPSRCSRAMPA